MLELNNFQYNDNILTFDIFIEGDVDNKYSVSIDTDTDKVVKSNIPIDYKIYERQALQALYNYKDKKLPDKITSRWY